MSNQISSVGQYLAAVGSLISASKSLLERLFNCKDRRLDVASQAINGVSSPAALLTQQQQLFSPFVGEFLFGGRIKDHPVAYCLSVVRVLRILY